MLLQPNTKTMDRLRSDQNHVKLSYYNQTLKP